jgi:starch synthase (maltosyl-transferring)
MNSLSHRLASSERRPWPARPVGVALVITDLDVGGAERALTALATRLDPSRWRVGVFGLSGPGELAEVIRGAGLPCECLGVSRHDPARAVARLASSLRRFRPELIQSFLFHANIAARLAAPWAGRPRPWVLGGVRVAERQRRWHLLLDRWTSRLVAGEVCVSRGVLAFSRDVGGLDPARLTVIPNGIDPAPIDAAEPVPRATIGVPDDAHLALCVGRLDPQKGLRDLLDAAGRVIARRPGWHLVLAGDGPERDRLIGTIEARADLRDHVRWLGRRDDVPGLLKSADVLVQASHWEGMPNTVLEAMAARRAVVGTAVEGTEDLVIPGETGWLVPPRDPAALAQALAAAAEDPDRCRRYGEAGRLRVEREFSLAAVVAAYERLWAGVLGLRPPDAVVSGRWSVVSGDRERSSLAAGPAPSLPPDDPPAASPADY